MMSYTWRRSCVRMTVHICSVLKAATITEAMCESNRRAPIWTPNSPIPDVSGNHIYMVHTILYIVHTLYHVIYPDVCTYIIWLEP